MRMGYKFEDESKQLMILHRTLVLYEWLIFHKKLQSSKDWSFRFHFVNFLHRFVVMAKFRVPALWLATRFKDYFFGKLISAVDCYDKLPYRDWRTDFVGKEGLIILYESEHKAPGKIFFHMLVGCRRMDALHGGGLGTGRRKRYDHHQEQHLYFFPPAQFEQRRKASSSGKGCSFREDAR